MPYVHARTVVASLTPSMRVKDIKSALKSVGLPFTVLSTSTGGPNRRTKVYIVAEARAAFVLPPFSLRVTTPLPWACPCLHSPLACLLLPHHAARPSLHGPPTCKGVVHMSGAVQITSAV